MNKTIAALAVLIIVAGGVYWYMTRPEGANEPVQTDTSSGMRAEENMIVIQEQRPGNTVTASQVHFAEPGFIVIHEDVDGAPGTIIGSSSLLPAGESSQIKITLTKSVADGAKLHAMLHSDTDNSGTFSASSDREVQSRLGGAIDGWFDVSSNASENPPLTI